MRTEELGTDKIPKEVKFMQSDNNKPQPDPRSFGFYGKSWEAIKSTREGLAYRLSVIAEEKPEEPKAYKGISPQEEDLVVRIDNASREDTLRTRPTLDQELAKEATKAPDWDKLGQSQLKAMGIDEGQYATQRPRWFDEWMEVNED